MEILEKIIFHWMYSAPLLYTPIDWGMCIFQIALVKCCITILRGDKNGKRKTNKSR